jgi:uncharacterized membrane protein required for colicin V production
MTWLEFLLIAVFVFFIIIGARMGSLWTGSCVVGGFFGAALVDIYTLSLSSMMGGFPGSTVLAALALYLGGLAVILIPGAVLSQIGSAFILNIIDGAFGLLTGAFAGLLLISVSLYAVSPFVPRLESRPAYKQSFLAKPLKRTLDEILSNTWFRSTVAQRKI